MTDLKLRFACDRYAHMRALLEGRIKPEGIELTCSNFRPEGVFQRLIKDKILDVSELGMSAYLSTLQFENPPFIAIPVFPSRSFRFSAVYVGTDHGIEKPEDLIGKPMGELHHYGHDGGVWARIMLSEEYGLPPRISDTYVTAGMREAHPPREWLTIQPPPELNIRHDSDHTLEELLISGEIAGAVSAHPPLTLHDPDSKVRRLIADWEPLERDFYARTGIFPMMHTLVIRRDLYMENRWVARSLYEAFKASKKEINDFYNNNAMDMHRLLMMPWASDLFARNRKLMGDDPWPYGVEPNRKAIETFCRHHHAQGISGRQVTVEEMFAPETMED
jgi:hypothetical protein